MKRVVLDTNVVVSGLLFNGRPGEIVTLWKRRRILPLCSKPMVEEILRVLAYPRFQLSGREIHALLYHDILPYIDVVPFRPGKAYVPEDPQDDMFVWCAISGKAESIVSGDAHLLSLSRPPVPVLSVVAFLEAFEP